MYLLASSLVFSFPLSFLKSEKKYLIAQAKLCVAQVDFSNEMVEKVKSLRTQWKEIGTCGRNKEDALWNEFNETVNTFFKNMKDYK